VKATAVKRADTRLSYTYYSTYEPRGENVRLYRAYSNNQLLNFNMYSGIGIIGDLQFVASDSSRSFPNFLSETSNYDLSNTYFDRLYAEMRKTDGIFSQFLNTVYNRNGNNNDFVASVRKQSDTNNYPFNKVFIVKDRDTGLIYDILAFYEIRAVKRNSLKSIQSTFFSFKEHGNIDFAVDTLPNKINVELYDLTANDSHTHIWNPPITLSYTNTLALLDLSVASNVVGRIMDGTNEYVYPTFQDRDSNFLTNTPAITNLYEKTESGTTSVYVGIEFSPENDNFFTNTAPTYLTNIEIKKTLTDGTEVTISTAGGSPALIKSGNGVRQGNSNRVLYKYTYTKPTNGDIDTESTYEVTINKTTAKNLYVPQAGQSLFSFTFDDVEYAVTKIEIDEALPDDFMEITLDKEPEFSAGDIVSSLVIGGDTTQLNTVTHNNNVLKFSATGAIANLDNSAVNAITIKLLESSASTPVNAMFSAVYEYRACYRWEDANGKEHYSGTSRPVNVTVTNYMGKQNTTARLNVKNLNLTEKDNTKIVIFRRLATIDPAPSNPEEIAGGNFLEETSFENNKATGVTTVVSNKRNNNNQLFRLLLDEVRTIFQPEGALSAEVQHDCLYLGGLNQVKDRVIRSNAIEKDNPIFISFSALENRFDIFPYKVLKVESLETYLIIFTEESISAKSGAFNNHFKLNPGDKNFLVNRLACENTPSGLIYESSKGLYSISRSFQFSHFGFDINKLIKENPINQVFVSEKDHEIFFLRDNLKALVYNHLHGKWSSVDDIFTLTELKGRFFKIAHNLPDEPEVFPIEASTENRNLIKRHELETGWFSFRNEHGSFYLKGISFLGDFSTYTSITYFLYYDFEDFHRETRTITNPDSNDELLYAQTDQTYGQARTRAKWQKVFRNIKIVPKNQKINGIKIKLVLNSNKCRVSNIGFDILPITHGQKQKSSQEVI